MKRTLKEAAKKNDKDACMVLAKEILHARKAITKIYTSKAHLNSVMLQMKNQMATLRVAGSLSKSTEVMQAMQSLIRVPEVAQTMQAMSKEMMKAGIIEEMLDDTMDVFEDTEEMEEEAQGEVDKVLWELTEGKLGEAPAPPQGDQASVQPVPAAPEVEDENEEEIEEMQSRLAALKS